MTAPKDTDNATGPLAREICFGLDRHTDEQSLTAFLRLFAGDELLATLVPRLEDEEILALVDQLSLVMRRHLKEDEYHRLFLGD